MATIKLKALCTIVDEKGAHAPGSIVEVKDATEAQALIDRGFAEEHTGPKAEKAGKKAAEPEAPADPEAPAEQKAGKKAADPEAPADGG